MLSIPILVLVHAVSIRKSKKRGLEFANFDALKRVSSQRIFSKQALWFFLHTTLLLLIVLSISGMTFWKSTEVGGINFVIAVDTSSSMLAKDVSPTRLDAAKSAAITFVNTLSEEDIGSEIAIVSFSGTAFSEADFSSEYLSIKDSINKIKVSDVAGTAIGEAIVLGTNLLSTRNLETEEVTGAIILITDGQSNVGIDTESAVIYSNNRNIIINTIGIGTTSGASMEGTNTLLKLGEDELIKISENSGGKYFYATNLKELEDAFEEIASDRTGKISFSLAPFFYIGILIITFGEWFFTVTRYRVIP